MTKRIFAALSFATLIGFAAFQAFGTPFGQYPGAFGIMGGIGQIGVGGPSVTPTWPLEVGGSWKAASGVAKGVSIYPTLNATANNNVLSGMVINPTFSVGTYTGAVQVGLAVQSGNVGIGTLSPAALLDVHGHVGDSGPAASVGTCGTSPSISGNDARGQVTTGSGTPSSCVITFAASYATAPYCVVSWVTAAANTTGISVGTSTSALTVTFSAATASSAFNYHCMQ